jgi:hypothetical protein
VEEQRLGVFANRELRGISGSKRDEATGECKNIITVSRLWRI